MQKLTPVFTQHSRVPRVTQVVQQAWLWSNVLDSRSNIVNLQSSFTSAGGQSLLWFSPQPLATANVLYSFAFCLSAALSRGVCRGNAFSVCNTPCTVRCLPATTSQAASLPPRALSPPTLLQPSHHSSTPYFTPHPSAPDPPARSSPGHLQTPSSNPFKLPRIFDASMPDLAAVWKILVDSQPRGHLHTPPIRPPQFTPPTPTPA